MQHYLNTKQLLDLLQITNSNFPIGSFSHSFGLETYICEEKCLNINDLKIIVTQYIYRNFLTTDLLAIKKSYNLYKNKNINEIFKLDNILNANSMSFETREANKRIGTQMNKIYLELFPDLELIQIYNNKIKNKECYGHPAISFVLLCLNLNIEFETCIYCHTYSMISNIIQNCVRAIPLGQIEGQKLIFNVKNKFLNILENLNDLDFNKNFCQNTPSLEIQQMKHENIHIRLFMS